jgi:hypothetical protein
MDNREPGVWGNDNMHFWHPQDVDINIDGRIYVSDTDNCRIQIYNSDGSYYSTIGGNCGDGINEFRWIESLAIAPNGDIFAAEPEYHRVKVYSGNLNTKQQ